MNQVSHPESLNSILDYLTERLAYVKKWMVITACLILLNIAAAIGFGLKGPEDMRILLASMFLVGLMFNVVSMWNLVSALNMLHILHIRIAYLKSEYNVD